MAVVPRCSECGGKLVYPAGHEKAGKPKPAGTKTDSPKCRARRHERMKKARLKGTSKYGDHEVQEMAAAVRGELTDMAHEVAKEELRPIVREAMTEDVLHGIGRMVQLTPRAVQILEVQMESSDEVIAQRAVTLLLKYTMGNPSVAPPPTQQAPAPMSVTFNIPRPGDDVADIAAAPLTAESEELRQCSDCQAYKTDAEFVGASPRCQVCFDELHAGLVKRFDVDDPTAPE